MSDGIIAISARMHNEMSDGSIAVSARMRAAALEDGAAKQEYLRVLGLGTVAVDGGLERQLTASELEILSQSRLAPAYEGFE